jgi:hypothetical protein
MTTDFEPSSEHILFQVQTTALIKALGKKRAKPFLRAMEEEMTAREAFFSTTPIRPSKTFPAVKNATLQAADVFRRVLPTLRAAMPR